MTALDLHARFGFHSMPFTREIAVDRRFTLPMFEEATKALERAITQRESAVLIAPAGTGKTNVLRALRARLPEARYHVTYVKVTELSKRDLCRELAMALDTAPAGTYSKLVRCLQERFVTFADTDGLRPVILLDEAHDIRPDVLGILRILTNFEMDSRLVVSIILAGQPSLRRMLRQDHLEDVARRMAHLATLRVLSRDETRAYIEHRLTIAGATSVPFDNGALEALYEVGRGNLRATDRLAIKTLEIAHDANRDVVDATDVTRARASLCP